MRAKTLLSGVLTALTLVLSANVARSQSCVGAAGQVKWSYWTGLLTFPDSSALFALENFPDHPVGSQILSSLRSPINFSDRYASMMRGFIHVPETATYTFNLTGDDQSIFYLSTNESPANKIKRAEVKSSGYTDIDEHDKYPSQTSVTLQLVAGQYYYFEMYNFDGGGGDHMILHWRKNAETTWRVIDYNFINEYACEPTCAVRGTPCNDGNPQTTNDQQDGFCNCVGDYPSANACVGKQRGVTEAYYYDNVPGSYIEHDLTNSPKFPLLPDRKELLKGAYGPVQMYTKDLYGTLVQGYLTVPVSGEYEFNITGDNQTFFFLSKNDSIQYKQTHQAAVFNGIGEYEHNNSSFQNISPIYLEKGKYYYFEFRHKENNYRDQFILYWKTPYRTTNRWKPVPKFYLFDYTCEISCIPQGTPCDDDNAFTNHDQYNNNCECVGTPCSGPDCDDAAARYKEFDSCAPTQNLLTSANDSWVSCGSSSANPNAARSEQTKWIMYDLNNTYTLNGTRVWNYNVAGQTNKGFKNVTVDYSMDGTSWTPLGGTYSWPQAPGTSDYSGFVGPNFNELKVRYVLVSAVDNWGDAICSGFSKITFDAKLCNPPGTLCDDGDPLTMYDKFDANCSCQGVSINCGSDTLALARITLSDGAYRAKKVVNAESIAPTTSDIAFTAGNSIVLLPGFETNASAVFKASIEDCVAAAFVANEHATIINREQTITDFTTDTTQNDRLKKIIFRLNQPDDVKLVLKDKDGRLVVTLIDYFIETLGTQVKLLPTQRLQKGIYTIELTVGKRTLIEELAIQ